MEKQVRANHFIDLDSTTIVPAPLADLLSQIGSFESNATGHHHHIIAPERPAAYQNTYWEVDEDLLSDWSALCARTQHHYAMKCFPKEDDYEKRPIVLTYIENQPAPRADTHVRIKAYTSEPQANDALIRLVNDDIFAARNDEFTAGNSHYYMTPSVQRNQVLNTYVGGYVLRNNA